MFSALSDEEWADLTDEFARIILLEEFLKEPNIRTLPDEADIKAVEFCKFLYERGTGNLKLDPQWLESQSQTAVFFRGFLGTIDLDKLHKDTLKNSSWCSIS